MIFDRDTWREVGETIGRNKRRSIATAFGVFWGIFMLIVLLSLSSGFRNGIGVATSNIAPNMLIIEQGTTSVPYKGLAKGREWSLQLSDLEYLKAMSSDIDIVAGVRFTWGGEKSIQYAGNARSGSILGITSNYFDAYYVNLLAGRMLNPIDHLEMRRFCLIGKELAEDLFGDIQSALGKVIKAKETYLTVVGVVSSRSKMVNIGPNMDRVVAQPLEAMSTSGRKPGEVDMCYVTLHNHVDKAKAKEKIEGVVKELKQISPDDRRAVSFFDLDEMLSIFQKINWGIDALVWIVGIGTLFTGIIGVSNILLVTVRERTQEIGIRRALGAKPSNILMQLLMEALSLTTLSGLLGIVLGVGIMSLVAGAFTSSGEIPFLNPLVDIEVVLVATIIIIVSGLIAGLIPALKALDVRAIEAIREE